jgi:hypothetical protein
MTETTVRKQNKSWQFQPGQSGNPKGRPQGCRHRATVAAEALLDGEAEGLTRKAIELALAGDTTALRLCIERILPARKDRPVQLQVPEIEGVEDLTKATMALVQAVAAGELSPTEAAEVAKLVEAHRRTVRVQGLRCGRPWATAGRSRRRGSSSGAPPPAAGNSPLDRRLRLRSGVAPAPVWKVNRVSLRHPFVLCGVAPAPVVVPLRHPSIKSIGVGPMPPIVGWSPPFVLFHSQPPGGRSGRASASFPVKRAPSYG